MVGPERKRDAMTESLSHYREHGAGRYEVALHQGATTAVLHATASTMPVPAMLIPWASPGHRLDIKR